MCFNNKVMYHSKWYQFILRHVTQVQCVNFHFVHLSKKFSSSFRQRNDENYYDTLGITKKATQNDIKSAYYKLSMQYHPDKNKGSDDAAKKFRDISQAYEVLGNFRLRRLYDKGIVHTAGSQYAHVHPENEPPEEDDPQTKFYKSRMTKSDVPPATGRTPIYDFDEWSRAHYGSNFERKKAARARYERKADMERAHAISFQKEMILFGLVTFMIGFLTFVYNQANLDEDKTKTRKNN